MRSRWLIPLVFVLFVAFVVYSTLNLGEYRCEVCVEFKGETACRTAQGASREDTIRTATDNACAQVAAGMTEIRACTSAPPARVNCEE